MKQKLFRFLRPRLALLLAAALVAAAVPNLPMTVEADAPTATWEDRDGVRTQTFDATKATTVSSYTYYDADGNAETVPVDSTTALGSKTNPISISSEADLILFGQQSYDDTAGKYYILDKDGSGGTYDMDGDNYSMLPLFATLKSNASSMYSYSDFGGVLIGNGSSITNVYIRGEDSGYLTSPGLFGILYGTGENPCEIMDITVKMTIGSVSSDYYTYVGGLAAEAYGTVSLSNVTVDVTVSDGGTEYTYFGGLIGYTDYGNSGSNVNISNCDVIPSVSEDATVGYYGGLIGYVEDDASATITDCAVEADDIQAAYCAGGLVGGAGSSAKIKAENCDVYAYNGIVASDSDWGCAGGLAGYAGDWVEIEAENCTVDAGSISAVSSSYGYAGTLLGYASYANSVIFTGCTADTVLTANSSNVYWPTAAIGDVLYYQSPPTLTYSDTISTISTIRLGSSDVYVALVDDTALTSVSEDSGIVTTNVSASGNGTIGSATVTSDGSVTLNVDVADANKTYELSSFKGILYLEDNTGSSYSPEAYWATLDTGSTFTNSSGSLSAGDGVDLLSGALRHTVTFDSQGGSSVDSQTVDSGHTANEPTAPTKDGYEFQGWYTDETYSTQWTFDTAVTASMTLYASYVSDVAITVAPTAIENLTYTSSAQALITAGTASGGTMYYSLTGNDDDWSTEIPTGINAGTYTVYYKAVDSDNETETEAASVSVTIGQAAQSISYDTNSVSKTAGDESFANELTETLIYGDITYTSSDTSVATVDSDGIVTIVGAGTATITATASGSDNYTSATASYTVTVSEEEEESTEEDDNSSVVEEEDSSEDSDTGSVDADINSDSSTTDAVVVADVQSGDETNLLLWIAVMLLVASGLTVTVIYSKKRTYRK
ncbi:MAG: InlB B-repeat-containing protein [Lachnospiraceae bacterium]|nr:InlB B-repeat-containing protein [Lachnospiraceae bacterium]